MPPPVKEESRKKERRKQGKQLNKQGTRCKFCRLAVWVNNKKQRLFPWHPFPVSQSAFTGVSFHTLAPERKNWADFFPAWNTEYRTLNSEELTNELRDEENNHASKVENVKELNCVEAQKNGCCKVKLLPHLLPCEQLNELRARAANESNLKSWFSNVKTKNKMWKLEPFCVWLSCLTSAHGAPQSVQLPWVLWQHPMHGKEKYGKEVDEEEDNADEMDGYEKETGEEGTEEGQQSQVGLMNQKHFLAWLYFAELEEDEQQEIRKQREDNFEEWWNMFQRMLQEETHCTVEELAERRHHTKGIFQ
ncbi:hypothetical protein DFH08DRAFT_818159 [Mycena albidolilacea]|uniref:Uncharacterized protein n=1 Tax=Mycena albidolilacea TaxID=1033008 RepID=A0AAD7EGK8_9AGAR|nr:hypothetical protein DFH08DRAFT_818159 [Mycena albidolilacea]